MCDKQARIEITAMLNLENRQQIEIDFWKNSPSENPESDSIENIVNKMGEAGVFWDLIHRYEKYFNSAKSILELGCGQGWASCILKRLYPAKKFMATDISPYAVRSLNKWERMLNCELDQSAHCLSYEIPAPDNSFDLIFCFAAAHHFVAHKRTLAEIKRVLRPKGVCLYLYEPVCPTYIHKLAHYRVNRKRPEVPEDVIRFKEILQVANKLDLDATIDFYPSIQKRGRFETIYFLILSIFPFLQRFLPTTGNLIFTKNIQ